jgi:hypothetical protein
MVAVSVNLLLAIGILALVGSFFFELLKMFLASLIGSSYFQYRGAVKQRRAARSGHRNKSGGLDKLGLAAKWSLQNQYIHPEDSGLPEFLLLKQELWFYGVLTRAVKDTGVIYAKVCLADVLMAAQTQGKWRSRPADQQISGRTIDFLICNEEDLSIKLAIELDGKKHVDLRQDQYLNNACKSAGLPLLRVNVASGYAVGDIRERLVNAMLSSTLAGAERTQETDGHSGAVKPDPESGQNVTWFPTQAKHV